MMGFFSALYSALGVLVHIAGVAFAAYVFVYLAIVLVLLLITKRVISVRGDVVHVRFGSAIPAWLGHDGFTCFGVVFVAALSAPADLIAHEYRHTQQERWLLYVLYPIAYLLLERATYRNNPLEVDAYAYGPANASAFPPTITAADLK
jgi:hypothetical protein